jgi:hypothetical protein
MQLGIQRGKGRSKSVREGQFGLTPLPRDLGYTYYRGVEQPGSSSGS